ncbi:hypothetical protein CRG98_003776 [Punica granatum]|uniref:Uncharacterized protein n=1 Tax=Punica granatum TaxID=22663 RepID=A0A2I0L567_PUNGR|nr:hypothetical protein CRG98_003776 [Punica granatum]
MKLLRRCSAPRAAVCLICRKPALLLGQLLVALPGAGFIAGAIVVCWGCPGRVMRDSSFGVERLRIPRGRKSESAVVLVVVVPMILTSLRPRCETSGAPVGLAWAYRDVLKGAQAALWVVRRTRELRTLLIRVP